MAVHQCLTLDQPVALPSHTSRMALATTWRKCDSYTCAGRKCQVAALSQLRAQETAFMSDLPALNSVARAMLHAGPPPPAAHRMAHQDRRDIPSAFTIYRINPNLVAAYYLVYMVTCCAVMVRWQWEGIFC
jgi:hypothetical protein